MEDTEQPITGWIEQGREIVDKANEGGPPIGVDGSVGVSGSAFGVDGEKCVDSGWLQNQMPEY